MSNSTKAKLLEMYNQEAKRKKKVKCEVTKMDDAEYKRVMDIVQQCKN